MAIFKSGNPTLSEKMFDKSMHLESNMQGTMSVRGAINKFGFLLLMVIAGAAFSWNLQEQGKPQTMVTVMIVGAIAGLITGFVITFKPNLARFLAPLYGLMEGLFI